MYWNIFFCWEVHYVYRTFLRYALNLQDQKMYGFLQLSLIKKYEELYFAAKVL